MNHSVVGVINSVIGSVKGGFIGCVFGLVSNVRARVERTCVYGVFVCTCVLRCIVCDCAGGLCMGRNM